MGILEEVAQQIEADKNKVYRFWFSAKQKADAARFNDISPLRLFVTINGKDHEYTECIPADHPEKTSNLARCCLLGRNHLEKRLGRLGAGGSKRKRG